MSNKTVTKDRITQQPLTLFFKSVVDHFRRRWRCLVVAAGGDAAAVRHFWCQGLRIFSIQVSRKANGEFALNVACIACHPALLFQWYDDPRVCLDERPEMNGVINS